MTQTTESPFSDDDLRLMKDHHLGKILHLYKMRHGYIIFNRVSNLIVFILCIFFIYMLTDIVTLLINLLSIFHILIWFGGLSLVLAVGYYLFVGLRHEEQSRHLIIGEYGLLEIKKMIRSNRVEVVYWKDIQSIRKVFIISEYLIKCRNGELFRLTPYVFQNGDELILSIREHEAERYNQK